MNNSELTQDSKPNDGSKFYPHLVRYGTQETSGIEDGECFIFSKVDGTNASARLEINLSKTEVIAGSRKRLLTIHDDNQGFCKWLLNQDNIKEFLLEYPDYILYGEWLKRHTIKTYKDDAWNKFYVFDVFDRKQNKFIHYNDYVGLLEDYKIEYIPVECVISNPTIDKLKILSTTKSNFLIKEGEGHGEGIVIKNYDYVNKYGRTTWAKIVNDEFIKNSKSRSNLTLVDMTIEENIINAYCTEAFIRKEYSKLLAMYDNKFEKKYIKELLGRVYYEFIKEEAYIFIPGLRNPKIDFRVLQNLLIQKVKEVLKDEIL